MSFKSFSIFSSDRHFVSEWNQFSNFGKGALEEHFCEIKLKSGHWHEICCLKVFFIFSSGGQFVLGAEPF